MIVLNKAMTRKETLEKLYEDMNGYKPTEKSDKYLINLLDNIKEVYNDICNDIRIETSRKVKDKKKLSKITRKEEIFWKLGIWLQKGLGIYINDYMVGGHDGTKGVYNSGAYTKGNRYSVGSRGHTGARH